MLCHIILSTPEEGNLNHATLFLIGYKPMNRIGMADISSTLLQMSFESTSVFMVDAALHKRLDPLSSPSANIVLGSRIKHGTGAFDCISIPT